MHTLIWNKTHFLPNRFDKFSTNILSTYKNEQYFPLTRLFQPLVDYNIHFYHLELQIRKIETTLEYAIVWLTPPNVTSHYL